ARAGADELPPRVRGRVRDRELRGPAPGQHRQGVYRGIRHIPQEPERSVQVQAAAHPADSAPGRRSFLLYSPGPRRPVRLDAGDVAEAADAYPHTRRAAAAGE